jgi:hypothetical protein
MIKKIINILPIRYKWTIHNLIAHPLSEIVHLLGNTDIANKIHDCTLPDPQEVKHVLNPERDD